jgi:hypothetical protein
MSEKISVFEEIYTHEYLWRAAELMLEEAKLNANIDERKSFYSCLLASLMSYMAFEAFINFSGYILFPEEWKDERNYFKCKGKGDVIEIKISKLLEKLDDFKWEKGKRPYQSIKELKAFRDMVSHGKVKTSQYEAIRTDDGSHIEWTHDWDNFILIEKIDNYFLTDIKTFCQSVLDSMRKKSDHPHLIFNAFEGSLASAQGSQIDDKRR